LAIGDGLKVLLQAERSGFWEITGYSPIVIKTYTPVLWVSKIKKIIFFSYLEVIIKRKFCEFEGNMLCPYCMVTTIQHIQIQLPVKVSLRQMFCKLSLLIYTI
jgi:hypothetical protein